jgi:hypothetical protein
MKHSYADIANQLLYNEGMDGAINGGYDSDSDSDLGEVYGADEDPGIEGFLSDLNLDGDDANTLDVDTNTLGGDDAKPFDERSPFVIFNSDYEDSGDKKSSSYDDKEYTTTSSISGAEVSLGINKMFDSILI